MPVIGGAKHVSAFTRRRLPTPGEHHAGIIGLDCQAARVGQRPFILDTQDLPGVAEVITHEHIACGTDEQALGPRRCDRHVVDIRVVHTGREMCPGVSTIHAAEHAVDFHTRPDNTMIVRVHGQGRHEWCADRALLGDVHGQFLPSLSSIQGAINSSRTGPSEKNVWINRIDG